LISQPSPPLPLQSLKPALQANPQAPLTHVLVENATCGQLLPHAPQLFTSVEVGTSQPSTADLLQSAKPTLQEPTPHVLLTQLALPFAGAVHFTLQPPQLFTLLVVLVSQPSVYVALQSAKPVLHVLIAQADAAHTVVAFGALQALLQAPQFAALLVVFTSQPLVTVPSQLAKPALQAMPQVPPAVQVADEFANVGQAWPQVPQLLGESSGSSQPLAELPSQSPKPDWQV
jgi:hypothetical protein